MATAIGIDIGVQTIKVAVIEGSAKQPRLTHFATHRLETDRTIRSLGPQDLADLLREVAARERLPAGANVVTALQASSAIAREVTVPFTRDDQIRKTIKFQAESVFHAVSIDDMIVDFYKLAEQGEKSRLLVIGIRKDILRERIEVLDAADLDPQAVDLDAAALFNALSLTPAVKEGKRVLGVDLGGATMKMVAIEGGKLKGLRSTRLQTGGAIKIGEKKAARPGGGSRETANMSLEDLKKNLTPSEREDVFFGGEEEGRLPVVILDEEQSELFDFAEAPEAERLNVLEKIFLEIDRTLASTRLEGPVDIVYLTGSGAATEGIEKAFSDHFTAPTERVSFKGTLASKLPRTQADALDLHGAVALGLALKGLGYDTGGLDFRQEEFGFQGKFDRAKRGVACGLVLLFVLFFVIAYKYQMVELHRLGTKQDYVRQYQRDIYLTVFPEEAQKAGPEDPLAALRKKERDLRQKVKGFGDAGVDVVSALDMLRDLTMGIEESGKKVSLIDLGLRQGRSVVKLEVENELVPFAIKEAVNGKPRLVTIQEGPIQKKPKTDNVMVEFTVFPPEKKKKPTGPAPKDED